MSGAAGRREPARSGSQASGDEAVRRYIDGIDPAFRPLFERLHRLIMTAQPGAALVLSYGMPTYQVDRGRLHVGVWKHGVSLYGWPQERAAEFIARHPGLRTSKGTIRLRPQDAADISDNEFLDLMRASLAPGSRG
jgi:uncharacterized protein YdhG (YjbR/CyaY superfamily)